MAWSGARYRFSLNSSVCSFNYNQASLEWLNYHLATDFADSNHSGKLWGTKQCKRRAELNVHYPNFFDLQNSKGQVPKKVLATWSKFRCPSPFKEILQDMTATGSTDQNRRYIGLSDHCLIMFDLIKTQVKCSKFVFHPNVFTVSALAPTYNLQLSLRHRAFRVPGSPEPHHWCPGPPLEDGNHIFSIPPIFGPWTKLKSFVFGVENDVFLVSPRVSIDFSGCRSEINLKNVA